MYKVYIDAGHGGNDSGAISPTGVMEKDRNLEFAMFLEMALNDQGIETKMNREYDTRKTLEVICAEEREYSPNCCISCHMDSAGTNTTASGVSILLHGQAPESYMVWAAEMLSEINSVGITSNRYSPIRKGYQGNLNENYYFNANTNSPSMILELGFITNAANLSEHIEFVEEYAEAVCKSICKFIGKEYIEQEIKPIPPVIDVIEWDDLKTELKRMQIRRINID